MPAIGNIEQPMNTTTHIHFRPRNSPNTTKDGSTDPKPAKPKLQEPAPLPQLYREVYKASGMTRTEIRMRLAWSNNASKMLRLLDFLLEGKCPVPEFEKRFIEVMEIPPDTLHRTRQQQAKWKEERSEEMVSEHVSKQDRQYGPRIQVLPNQNYKPQTMFGRWGMHLGCRIPLDMSLYPADQPPTQQEIARCIASMDPSLKSMLPLRLDMIGGYLYYRLPGEMYAFDAKGSLVGFGDTYTGLPDGAWEI